MDTISICRYCTPIVRLPKHKRCFGRARYPSPDQDSIPVVALRRDSCLLILLPSATGYPNGATCVGQPHIAFIGSNNLLPILLGTALVRSRKLRAFGLLSSIKKELFPCIPAVVVLEGKHFMEGPLRSPNPTDIGDMCKGHLTRLRVSRCSSNEYSASGGGGGEQLSCSLFRGCWCMADITYGCDCQVLIFGHLLISPTSFKPQCLDYTPLLI